MLCRRPLCVLVLLVAWSAAWSGVARAGTSVWDAANDFSATSNPAGAWSYGWSQSRGSGFELLPTLQTVNSGAIEFWTGSGDGTTEPDVFYNDSDAVVNPAGTNPIPAHSLGFHPGPAGQNAIVRWTAPSSGTFDVNATFTGRDDVGGTTTDVAVLLDGSTPLWSASVNGYLDSHSFEQALSLTAGATVDFTVGYGSDGNYFYDSTGLDATISQADTRPPTISCSPPPSRWYASDVSVPCTASDDGSGLANSGDASFTLSTSVPAGTETASAATDTHTVCDNSGNCSSVGPFTFMVDESLPRSSVPRHRCSCSTSWTPSSQAAWSTAAPVSRNRVSQPMHRQRSPARAR